jgi:hypothetical protein
MALSQLDPGHFKRTRPALEFTIPTTYEPTLLYIHLPNTDLPNPVDMNLNNRLSVGSPNSTLLLWGLITNSLAVDP